VDLSNTHPHHDRHHLERRDQRDTTTGVRAQCPCANCVTRIRGALITLEQVPPDVRPLAEETVGRYAVQFAWSDGFPRAFTPSTFSGVGEG
jgi:DUF971 family protein